MDHWKPWQNCLVLLGMALACWALLIASVWLVGKGLLILVRAYGTY